MQKVTGHISAVIKGLLFIGIGIQTVMGIVWMCCNFPNFPQYGDSLFYMQVSKSLRCDEYTGILYPVFVRIMGGNHFAAYGVQLIAAYAAARRFLGVFLQRNKAFLTGGCLAVLTVPMVMQCHLALLPCSFAASLMLVELSLLGEAIKDEEKRTLRRLAEICLCWLALALLLPEYLYLGALPVVLFGLFCHRGFWESRKKGIYGLLLTAAFLGMILGGNSLTQTRGLYGKVHRTPLMTLTQRIAWTSLLLEFESWHEEIQDCIDREEILGSALYADGMEERFFPVMEQAIRDGTITRQQVEACYKTMIQTAWLWHKKAILKEMAWDMLGYGAAPAVIQALLEGRGYDSYSNRNYDFFLEYTPGISKLYMDYGSWWFIVMLFLAAALQIMRLFGGGRPDKKKKILFALCCFLTAGTMAFWYTMRGAGMMDYKNTVVILQLWMAWPILLSAKEGTPQS